MCTILACFPLIVACKLLTCQIAHQTHKNNTRIFSKCELHHKHKQEPQDIAHHKPYLKVLYNKYAYLLMDNSMDNSNMAMLSMEPRKMIIILHNNNCLTSCLIIYKHFTGLQKSCNCWQTKCYLCYYHPKVIETILSICYVHTHHL